MSLGHIFLSQTDALKEQYLYTLSDPSQRVLYVGTGYLADIFKFTDLKANPAFKPDLMYRLDIHAKFARPVDAMNAAQAYLRQIGGAPLNNTAYINRRMSRVLCNETGISYTSAAEAARVMQISQPALSQHLARKPGYRQVKGYTFQYTDYFGPDLMRTAKTDPKTWYSGVNKP